MARDTISPTMSESSSGLSLVLRLQSGSTHAWADFVRLYGPLLDRWCRASRVPEDAIPDVAQSVFLTAFRKVADFDPSRPAASFRGWLWSVTRSRIADYFRRRGIVARGGSTAEQAIGKLPDHVPQSEPSGEDDVHRLLHRALKQIQCEFESSTWDMFWRAVVLGHPTDLIADEYRVSTAAVRQARSRILRRLRRQLGP